MDNAFLVITSIAGHDHPVLMQFANETASRDMPFIVIGDTKSPSDFALRGCDYYSVERQKTLKFTLNDNLPYKHYARKNIGYLIAMSKGAEIIIETDDDNYPMQDFWKDRVRGVHSHVLDNKGWVNVYKYFSKSHIWPRGFALEHLQNGIPRLESVNQVIVDCPIQQGLADENPDVDAIYRLTLPLPITFDRFDNVAIGNNSFCPFNSQNTTWFRESFPLLYLPSYCSFRMTDIWRSFVAQRIAWTCGWPILFHNSTVRQDRNDHNLMDDFNDEMPGYNNNSIICKSLKELNLAEGIGSIAGNIILCYRKLIDMNLIDQKEMLLLEAWLEDVNQIYN
jgi:hypothetical protein